MAEVETILEKDPISENPMPEDIQTDQSGSEGRRDEEEDDLVEAKSEKPLDDDQDRRNPQYIPKGGAFYEHDNRTSLEDVENEDPQELEKKKKVWKESKESERWLHDCYNESDQTPKSAQELIDSYGYDIRNEEAPPRARRRRKYGRGPDKYDRSWEDEQAYLVKQSSLAKRNTRRRNFGKDEFPPLPNQKLDSSNERSTPKPTAWKNNENGSPKSKMINDKHIGTPPSSNRIDHTSHHSDLPGFHANKKVNVYSNRKVNEDEIKPFKNDGNKWKNNIKPRQEDIPTPIKTHTIRQSEPPFTRNHESNRNVPNSKSRENSDVQHLTENFNQLSFQNAYSKVRGDYRPKPNEISIEESKALEQEADNIANRQNPKRYSKIRKGFTGFFPTEEIAEIGEAELKQLQGQESSQQPPPPPQPQQHVNIPQQAINMQNVNVMRRYPGPYNGNASYIPTRPIISGIPQPGIAPQGIQQTLSPQGIPQQALSPQLPGLPTIDLQSASLAGQANFVPPIYIDMEPHYAPSDVMGAFTSYPPYSANQGGDVYQSSSGITYYSPECQNSGPLRPPPARRAKAAIPIVPPPE